MPDRVARQPPASPAPAIASNLRYLCSLHRSTSEVCRSIEINRQQFNKYLSGSTTPSMFNLGRIAAFFGLEGGALCQPTAEFRRTVGQLRPQRPAQPASPIQQSLSAALIALATLNADVLRPYVGFYFRYNYAFDSSGRVVRGLFRISEADGIFVTRLIERVQHRSNGSSKLTTLKYDGVLAAASGCLFNIEYERLMRSCIGHAAFPCIMRPGQRFLTGLQSSYSSSTGRPAASRVLLERVEQGASLRELLRRCGTFRRGDGSIDADVLHLIGNRVPRETDVFSPPAI